MVFRGTYLTVADNSGAKIAKCLQVMQVGNKQIASAGNLILVSLKKIKIRKKVAKRLMYVGLVVGVKQWLKRNDGTLLRFFLNRMLLFNKQFKFLGTRIYGLIIKETKIYSLKKKKQRTYFHKILSHSSFII